MHKTFTISIIFIYLFNMLLYAHNMCVQKYEPMKKN